MSFVYIAWKAMNTVAFQLILVISSHSKTETVPSRLSLDFACFGHSLQYFCPSFSWKYPEGQAWHPDGLRTGGPVMKRARPVSEAYPFGQRAVKSSAILDNFSNDVNIFNDIYSLRRKWNITYVDKHLALKSPFGWWKCYYYTWCS